MSKYVFDPRAVPMYPQVTSAVEQDLSSDTIVTPNHYIMKARAVSGGAQGPWGVIQLPEFSSDPLTASVVGGLVFPWEDSPLKDQKATLDIGTLSRYSDGGAYIEYVSAVNINLLENYRYATSGVNVWFRWMPAAMFATVGIPPAGSAGGTLNPPEYQQVTANPLFGVAPLDSPFFEPYEWNLIGTYQASSFTTAIPRNTDTTVDKYFQILVTDNTTIRPDRYNYRWMSETNISAGTGNWGKIGEPWYDEIAGTLKYGYLPWNPYYGASKSNTTSYFSGPWDSPSHSYTRQRSTMQDIALFYPRKWKA